MSEPSEWIPEPSASILSHGERDVAGYLRGGESDPAAIAASRGTSEEAVRKAIDRIEGKTRRAVATLAESPFTEAVARDLDPDVRAELLDRLREPDGDRPSEAD